jgi:hypothetical protein
MHRLLIPALLALALSGCAGAPVLDDARPVQAQARDARTLFVRVTGGSPDAVLLQQPEAWAPVLARLELGQALVGLEERSGPYTRVRTRDDGLNTEGWVYTAALGARPPQPPRDSPDGLEVARQLYPYEEFEDSPITQRRLLWLEDFEERLSYRVGGDAFNPDSVQLRDRFRQFGHDGGILPD